MPQGLLAAYWFPFLLTIVLMLGVIVAIGMTMRLPTRVDGFVEFVTSVEAAINAGKHVFAEKPIYRFYVDVPRLWGLTAGEDQRIAGLLMKIGGGLLLWMVITVLFFKWHTAEEQNDRDARHWRELERELDQGHDSMRWTG